MSTGRAWGAQTMDINTTTLLLHDGAATALEQVTTFVAHPYGVKAIGSVTLTYAVISFFEFVQKYERVKHIKKAALSKVMVFRFNLAAWLFFILLVLGAFLKLTADDVAWESFNKYYRPMQAILAIATLWLLIQNYLDLLRNSRDPSKKYKTSLAQRLKGLHQISEGRGIRTSELFFVPILFLFPWAEDAVTLLSLVSSFAV
jgi:hypothetical protein